MQKNKIISFGETVWDVYKDGKTLGGAPFNFACYCGCLGADAMLVSAVGADEDGRRAIESMRKLRMPQDCMAVSQEHPTGKVIVSVSECGQPKYEITPSAAWDFIEAGSEAIEFAVKADAISFGTLAQRAEKSRASLNALIMATSQKCLKVFDANLRQNYYSEDIVLASLELANVLKINEDELRIIAGYFGMRGSQKECALELFCRFNLNYVLLTRGERGHLIVGDNLEIEAPAKETNVVDTVGAGDAFTAAFVCNILQCKSPEEASSSAADFAAEIVGQKGALKL